MSLFSAIGHIAQDYMEARSRYLTERQLGELPFEIQKDIGWPAQSERRENGRWPATSSAK